MKTTGIDATSLYETGANMNCMSYMYNMKLKDQLPLKNVPKMSVHSVTGHHLCLIGLMCCGNMIGNLQFRHTFIVCKNL